MNEMETLYEEFRALRREVQEKDYDEVGAFELREYRRRFERLHTRNLELQSKSRRSEDVDDEELRQILDLGDRMWFELGEALKPIVQVIDIKMALGKQMAEERDRIRTTNADYVSIINSLKKRLKANKKRFESVTAPEAKEILDQNIKDDEETIRHLEELVEKNNTRFKELGEKIRILIVKGGRLPEVEDTKEDTEGLDPEEVTERTKKIEEETEEPIPGLADEPTEPEETVPGLADEPTEPEEPVSGLADEPTAEGEGLPGVSFGDVDPITPVAGTDDPTEPEEPVPGLADEPTAEGEGLPGLSFDDIDPITPVAGTDDPTEPEEPVPGLEDEPTESEEPIPELPDEPTESEEPIPELPDEPTESEEPIPELPEEPEEELPVRASVKQPRTRLWQRVPAILQAAAVFLLTAIAAHTGYIARSTNKPAEKTSTDIVEETTTPVVTPTATPAPSAEPAETSTATPAPSAEPAETPTATPAPSVEPTAATPAPTATPAPAANPTPTATPTPTSTAEPTVTPTVNENNIILNQGESVYNSETGVEVGYTGIAGLETKDGYVPQENRDLEKGQDGTVIVTKSDLKPDTVVSALPRTGKEVSEETAKKNMTVEEKDNLEEATKEVDWESFFNDGPMLQ